MRAAAVLLLTALLGAAGAGAQEGPPTAAPGAPLEAPALIGLGLADVFARLGAPAEVLAVRGPSPGEDDVVFYYPQHLYLFWFQNRVWQVRFDRRHDGAPFAVRMGSTRSQVAEALGPLGPPLGELPDGVVYQLEDRGYPVRLRLYFEEDRLVDLYCYRADL
jgi:hypothetical protein